MDKLTDHDKTSMFLQLFGASLRRQCLSRWKAANTQLIIRKETNSYIWSLVPLFPLEHTPETKILAFFLGRSLNFTMDLGRSEWTMEKT